MKLIKFEKNGCTPCLMVDMFLSDKDIKPNRVVDVIEQTEEAEKYGVLSVPVLMLVDDEGNEVQRSTGFNPSQLETLISQL